MTQTSINYAKVLYDLHIPEQSVEEAGKTICQVPQVKQVLLNPVIMKKDKERIIDKIFPKDMVNFLKVICQNQDVELLEEIFTAYHSYACKMQGILEASITYAAPPSADQINHLKAILCKKHGRRQVDLTEKKDESLIGGFILWAEGRETDWSLKGRLNALQQKLKRR